MLRAIAAGKTVKKSIVRDNHDTRYLTVVWHQACSKSPR